MFVAGQNDYYNVLMQLHPQSKLGGDFSSNMSIIASNLYSYDATVVSLMTELNPTAWYTDGTGKYIQNYAKDFVQYIPPADSTNNEALTSLTQAGLTQYAERGAVSMLPYSPGKYIFDVRTTILPDSSGAISWYVSNCVCPIQIMGWNVNFFENTTPFFFVNDIVYAGTGPKQLYATPIGSDVYDASNQFIANVELFPQLGSDSSVSYDAIKDYIINSCPGWVQLDFYNNFDGSHFPGSTLYGGSGVAHWSIPGSGNPYIYGGTLTYIGNDVNVYPGALQVDIAGGDGNPDDPTYFYSVTYMMSYFSIPLNSFFQLPFGGSYDPEQFMDAAKGSTITGGDVFLYTLL